LHYNQSGNGPGQAASLAFGRFRDDYRGATGRPTTSAARGELTGHIRRRNLFSFAPDAESFGSQWLAPADFFYEKLDTALGLVIINGVVAAR
jgi:hypothetical protein